MRLRGHSRFADVVLRDGNDVGMDSIHDDVLDVVSCDDTHVDGDGMKIMMTFGNPPYQGEPTGKSGHTLPIYQDFIDIAKAVSNEIIMITPARFLNDGKPWSVAMLNDNHYQIVNHYANSTEVFPMNDIKGGARNQSL